MNMKQIYDEIFKPYDTLIVILYVVLYLFTGHSGEYMELMGCKRDSELITAKYRKV